jgi:vancomycin resistance protein YoaR
MGRKTVASLAIGLGLLFGVGGVRAVEPHLPMSPTVVGLMVAGQELSPSDDAHAWLEQRERVLEDKRVTLQHGEHRFETTLAKLGVGIDIEATLARAVAVGHSGSVVKRLRETAQAKRGEIDVALVYQLDDAIAREALRTHSDALAVAPVDARLDLEQHRKIADAPGQELDVVASFEEFSKQFTKSDTINLVTRGVPANVRLEHLDAIDVDKVLASFETRFKIYKRGRSANVELATKKLNGTVLRPLETLSFNHRVGPRTRAAGFKEAPEIVGDELTTGIGGGTCQVSSTLHGAALYGGLDVLQRKSHSRPSGYTKLGLDATVAYPSVDLKLKNPFNFTIVVHAIIPKPGLLRVELLGGEMVSDVKYAYGVSSIEEYVRRITTKSWLKSGKAFRKQKGTRGMDVHSFVTIHFKDGRVEKRQYYSGYRASPEVYWVASDYQEDALPPLPKHAKGVEGKLADDGSDVYPSSG